MTQTSGMGAMWLHKRVLAASLIGTAVEFYDFYIYATAASLIFPSLFFPASSPSAHAVGGEVAAQACAMHQRHLLVLAQRGVIERAACLFAHFCCQASFCGAS